MTNTEEEHHLLRLARDNLSRGNDRLLEIGHYKEVLLSVEQVAVLQALIAGRLAKLEPKPES